MTDPTLTFRGTVYPGHHDHMGHMNVMWYVGRFDEATWQLFARIGITREYMERNHLGLAAVHQEIGYRRELHAGDVISIHSGVVEVRDKVLRYFHALRNDATDEVCAVARLATVALDTRERRSRPYPLAVRERALALVVDEAPVIRRPDAG